MLLLWDCILTNAHADSLVRGECIKKAGGLARPEIKTPEKRGDVCFSGAKIRNTVQLSLRTFNMRAYIAAIIDSAAEGPLIEIVTGPWPGSKSRRNLKKGQHSLSKFR